MPLHLSTAPCCWGVDDPNNPFLPPWRQVLQEAALAGYQGIELGPFGYLPNDAQLVGGALASNGLHLVAGTIFEDLVSPDHRLALLEHTHAVCALLKQLSPTEADGVPPYLVIIDWGDQARDYAAGHSERAVRLDEAQWAGMIGHIREIAQVAWKEYGVRAVVHPHAGGFIEFADELERLVRDIPYEVAGLCLDTGHLYYAGMDPVSTLRQYAHRLDYLHVKDIDQVVFEQVLGQRIRFFDACALGVMCPIGCGVIDYPALRVLLGEIDYQGYVTVEQERDPRNADGSLADVTASRVYLTQSGF